VPFYTVPPPPTPVEDPLFFCPTHLLDLVCLYPPPYSDFAVLSQTYFSETFFPMLAHWSKSLCFPPFWPGVLPPSFFLISAFFFPPLSLRPFLTDVVSSLIAMRVAPSHHLTSLSRVGTTFRRNHPLSNLFRSLMRPGYSSPPPNSPPFFRPPPLYL